ncbi:Ca2+/H+ antiporter [Clostridium pasteurianum BC1]|uniref:Ca2+/H+ antiporter n=1 Tax=Clostridium pasteurianum BC1 TaxID=86416 RepID=R4JY73_CLOPA|nr:Ca2+/H+ antiporter [Clostridium pasteurianum BC1]
MKWLKFLFVFIPISIVLEVIGFHNPLVLFIVSCLSIIPLAGLMGEATEEIAAYAGSRVGGFLNATFGNATELIISILAIRAGLYDVVKASIAELMSKSIGLSEFFVEIILIPIVGIKKGSTAFFVDGRLSQRDYSLFLA